MNQTHRFCPHGLNTTGTKFVCRQCYEELKAELEAKRTFLDECEQQYHGQKRRAELAEADLAAARTLLPSVYYMDPPDGGDVGLIEQLRRMAKDAERYRWLRGDVQDDFSTRWSRWRIEHWASPGPTWSDIRGADLDAAIDAAIAGEREK